MPELSLVETTPTNATELRQCYEAIEREYDKAGFDQKVAALFNRSGMTQQVIADALGITQPYVGYLLRFGRFIATSPSIITTVINLGDFTERAFRKLWDNTTSRDEEERFRQVLRAMGHDVPTPVNEPERPAPSPRRNRAATNQLIAEIARERGVTSGQRLSDIRNVVELGEPHIVAMMRADEVGLQAVASYARTTPREEQVGATPATVRRIGNQRQAVGRTAARQAPPPRSTPRLVVPAPAPRVRNSTRINALTREQIDPEFTGTPMEFHDRHGHVSLETAEQKATGYYSAIAAEVRNAIRARQELEPAAQRLDHQDYWLGWLRNPKERDTLKLTTDIVVLRQMLAEAEVWLARAVAVRQRQDG